VSTTESVHHPIRLVVTDDLSRSRLTVFFRGLIAIPHYLWAALLGAAVFFCVFANWFILLVKGKTPDSLHGFIAGYTRYLVRVEAYFLLAANPFPGFYLLDEKPYPVDLHIDPPTPQKRWKTFFRLFLAVPAILISSTLFIGGARTGGYVSGGAAFVVAFLCWFVALARGRVPRGMRDLIVYCLGYSAQLTAYLFLITDRYPYTGPEAYMAGGALRAEPPPPEPQPAPEPHPVHVTVTDSLRRSRLLVFFRLPLSIPHILWALLWTVVAAIVGVLTWLCALVIGRAPRPFHRFLARYVRYTTHLGAFVFLVGNPFPGFTGKPGSYPVELDLPDPEPQKRLVTFFRLLLAVPIFLIVGGAYGLLWTVGLLGWFVSLFLGRMPQGLRNAGAYALRYAGQVNAYLYLLTQRYPDSGPHPDPASP
jgi:hypothetical protein